MLSDASEANSAAKFAPRFELFVKSPSLASIQALWRTFTVEMICTAFTIPAITERLWRSRLSLWLNKAYFDLFRRSRLLFDILYLYNIFFDSIRYTSRG